MSGTRGGPVVVIGDVLLDRDIDGTVSRLCPDAPAPVLDESSSVDRAGGAGLAAQLAAAGGREVVLITALGDDAGGARISELLTAAGVTVYALPAAGPTAEKVRLRTDGRVLLRLDRGGAPAVPGAPCEAALNVLKRARAVLVSDYGRGVTRQPALREALAGAGVPIVWDPHPRGAPAVPGTRLITPNESELRSLTGIEVAGRLAAAAQGADVLRRRWRAAAVAVTMGAEGALLCQAGAPLALPPPRRASGDTCGAGDSFAAAAAAALADGALVSEAVERAVARAAVFVADGGAAGLRTVGPPAGAAAAEAAGREAPGVPRPRKSHAPVGAEAAGAVAADVRARGGTVVATGGCFDLLHAGHVATLEAARALGDCLIVCLNSNASVAALKGPRRPVVPQADRARLLAALSCVDAVVIFDESTPEAVLSWLRPHVWVKGGDYSGGTTDASELPEAELVARWGGQTVIVPYLAGRSTTRMIAAARSGTGARQIVSPVRANRKERTA